MKDSHSTRNLYAIISLLLVFIVTTHTPSDADMWWHLRAGEEMFRRGQILTHDVFSYTRAGATWLNAFWVSDLGMYGLYQLGGLRSLAIASALLGVITFGIILLRGAEISFLSAGSIILAALAAAPFWSPRPQLISFLFLALLDFWIMLAMKGKGPPLWLMPLYFALWANLHGGFIWGVLLLIAYIVGESLEILIYKKIALFGFTKKLLLWTSLSLLAVLLNPNGVALWSLPFTQLNVSLGIQEWQSPDFHQVALHPTLWLLLLLVAASTFGGSRLNLSDLFKVAGFTYLAFIAQRNIAPYAIILTPILIDQLQNARRYWLTTPLGKIIQQKADEIEQPRLRPGLRKTINIGLICVVALVAVARIVFLTQPREIEKGYPVQAVQWLLDHSINGHLFNSYNWGGYLLWTLPQDPVFIDGRADLYGNDLIHQWQDVVDAKEDAFNILDNWQVRVILLEPGWPILGQLAEHGWTLAYQDSTAVIWTR